VTDIEQRERRRGIVRGFSDPGVDRWQHFAPDFRWRMIGTTAVSGVAVGRAGIDEKMAPLRRGIASNRVYVDAVIGEGDRFVKLAHTEGVTSDGRPFRNELATVFVFDGDVIIEAIEYVDTALISSVVDGGPRSVDGAVGEP
jgi:ketosteroid isomerase-like protein